MAIALPVVWGVPGINHAWRGVVRETWFLNARIEQITEKAAEAIAPDVGRIPKKDDTIIADGQSFLISSPFGPRDLCKNTVGSCDHKGADVAAKEGTPVCIPGEAGGEVTYKWVPTKDSGGYGNLIEAYIPSRNTTYYLAHLKDGSAPIGTPQNKEVKGKTGRVTIAAVGNTGNSLGAHLHLGAKENGEWRSPTIQELTEAMCGSYDPTIYRDKGN
jgi:murein DD-endopeptidase MepM/ murein hydrolase activator NlpD